MPLPDGVVAFVKADCETCVMVAPVLRQLVGAGVRLTVYSQDDPDFPPGFASIDDSDLEASYRQRVEVTPTLVRFSAGRPVDRLEGWARERWEELTGVDGLGPGLPHFRPGCGSMTLEPGMPERLAARYDGDRLRSRRVALGEAEDEFEAAFERGWTDGLPVVPPTAERVFRMLSGTRRPPAEVVAVVPPDLVECTVEKVAVNAVMAGCRPEVMPLLLAAVAAACTPEFNVHGLIATTYFSGPMLVVNGPLRHRLGMASGINALGQGNRAGATAGRALQLVFRNVGGGRPGEIDRANLGWPGKVGFAFAEDEEGSPWEPLAVARGFPPGTSAVTLFAAGGLIPIVDQASRAPASLAASFAAELTAVAHPKLALAFDAFLVVSPEHARVFREGGWDRARLNEELARLTLRPGRELVRGAGGIAEGMPVALAEADVPKFRPGGLWLVHAGGRAGMFSAAIPGWVSGAAGSEPVTVEVTD